VNFVVVAQSSLVPDRAPARIAYRCAGPADAPPLVFLHGGWGYEMYPFDRQIARFSARWFVVVPDRSGYGVSPPLSFLPTDFHRRAVDETLAVVDALALDRPVLWGHSDGAIIALRLALARPDRVRAAIAEATHFFRRKPSSQTFFENVIASTASTPIMRAHAEAWLRIGAEAPSPSADFYDGQLGAIAVPALVVHGGRDPRTESGEIDALRRAAPMVQIRIFDGAGHSPHSEAASMDAVTETAAGFLDAA
jgi:pimeloyl-ACP methyl ester carboxylesterase